MPPRGDPATARPTAAPRFLLKYCDMAAIPGAIVILSRVSAAMISQAGAH